MKKKSSFRDILLFVAIIAILTSVASFLFEERAPEKIQYSDIVRQFEASNVEKGIIDGEGMLKLTLKQPYNGQKNISFDVSDSHIRAEFRSDCGELIRQQIKDNTIVDFDVLPAEGSPWWMMFLPYIVVILVIGIMWFFMYSRRRSRQGNAFRKSTHKARK